MSTAAATIRDREGHDVVFPASAPLALTGLGLLHLRHSLAAASVGPPELLPEDPSDRLQPTFADVLPLRLVVQAHAVGASAV